MNQATPIGQDLEQLQQQKWEENDYNRSIVGVNSIEEQGRSSAAEELNKLKEENKALGEKLQEAEQKAQVAKNELDEFIQTSRHKLEELANEIAKLKEMQQKETDGKDEMKLSETPENTKDSPCLRLLPLETWVDIFAFLHRPQLAELVPQIGDWHFSTKAQYYLHECGQITLGDLDITRTISWINRDGPPIVKFYEYNDYQTGWEFPMADVPIPKNIIGFETIHISYFNESVFGFLQKFHRNSLLTNVKFFFKQRHIDSEVLPQIVSLLTSIEHLNLYEIDVVSFINKEYSARMLAFARILRITRTICSFLPSR